jgi:hypothetical protein
MRFEDAVVSVMNRRVEFTATPDSKELIESVFRVYNSMFLSRPFAEMWERLRNNLVPSDFFDTTDKKAVVLLPEFRETDHERELRKTLEGQTDLYYKEHVELFRHFRERHVPLLLIGSVPAFFAAYYVLDLYIPPSEVDLVVTNMVHERVGQTLRLNKIQAEWQQDHWSAINNGVRFHFWRMQDFAGPVKSSSLRPKHLINHISHRILQLVVDLYPMDGLPFRRVHAGRDTFSCFVSPRIMEKDRDAVVNQGTVSMENFMAEVQTSLNLIPHQS